MSDSKINEAVLEKFTERIAQALAVRDCEQAVMDVPDKDHKLWSVWNDGARAVVEELKKELTSLFEYENTINWMTTCKGCAQVLDSSYQETVRRELSELTLKEISDWAHTTRHGHAAGEVLNILAKGKKRQEKTMKGESDETVAGPQD